MFLFHLLVLSDSIFHVHLCVGVTDIRGDMQRTQRGWTWVRPRRQRELARCVGVVKAWPTYLTGRRAGDSWR